MAALTGKFSEWCADVWRAFPRVAWGDVIAFIGAPAAEQAELRKATLAAVNLEQQRDLGSDPACGIEQMATIAWTSVSTSKSNPSPGLLTVRSLRDLLARWIDEGAPGNHPGAGEPLPVVYADNVFAHLLDAPETVAVASTESMQHQNFAEVVRALSALSTACRPSCRCVAMT